MKTQTQKVLSELRRRKTATKTQLVRACGGYHIAARIWDLRNLGWIITNRIHQRGRMRVSTYTLA